MIRRGRPFVYFLRPVGAEGPIKIGCSQSPESRLAAILPWSPINLEIVARMAGDEEVEARLHNRFGDEWMHGEWFAASPALTETILAVANGTFDLSCLPEPKRLPARRKPMTARHRLRLSYGQKISHALRGYFTPASITALCRQLETCPEVEVADIRARLDAVIADPESFADPIDMPWAVVERGRRAEKKLSPNRPSALPRGGAVGPAPCVPSALSRAVSHHHGAAR